MSCDTNEEVFYSGDDTLWFVDLGGFEFADLQDMFVLISTNRIPQKICKISETDADKQIVVNPDSSTSAMFKTLRSETKDWDAGMMNFEVTFVYGDGNFPDGRHETFKADIVKFVKTHNSQEV